MPRNSGVWTTVHEESDRVLFRWSKTYARGRIVGLVFVISGPLFVVYPLNRDRSPLWFSLLLIIPFGMVCFRILRKSLSGSPKYSQGVYLAVLDENADCEDLRGDFLRADSINGIVLRLVNMERNNTDNMPLWQVWLELIGSASNRLVFQQPYGRRGYECAKSVATKLASRWNVKFVEAK